MPDLNSVLSFCDSRTRINEIQDFENAHNGLQIENNGIVTKIAAAVDAGQIPFEDAIKSNADFLICHHGIFWSPLAPIAGHNYKKIKTALDHNLAVYSAHLPLDCHPEIGNNALLAKALKLKPVDSFIEYKGTKIGLICEAPQGNRKALSDQLKALFPETYGATLFGDPNPKRIAILTGSGQSAVSELIENNVDTLITGELKQHHFNLAQELKLNLYHCGHYATEVFGVKALAQEVADHFKIEWTFLDQACLI